jgi:hypothetical protein
MAHERRRILQQEKERAYSLPFLSYNKIKTKEILLNNEPFLMKEVQFKVSHFVGM